MGIAPFHLQVINGKWIILWVILVNPYKSTAVARVSFSFINDLCNLINFYYIILFLSGDKKAIAMADKSVFRRPRWAVAIVIILQIFFITVLH